MKKKIIAANNVTLKSYAKLNLNIKIGDYDKSVGLHRIESELIAIDFFETLTYSIELYKGAVGAELEIEPNEQNCGRPEGSSVYKAANAWTAERGLYAKISLKHDDAVKAKTGLGIASSNAGCTILLLEALSKKAGLTSLEREQLATLSLKVGSDVPFFTLGENHAKISGFGEVVEPIKNSAEQTFLLHIPPHISSTKNAFASIYKDGKKLYDNFLAIDENGQYYEFLRDKTKCDEWKLTGSGSAFFIQNPSKELIEKAKNWREMPTRLTKSVPYSKTVLV